MHNYGVQLAVGAPSIRAWLPLRRLRALQLTPGVMRAVSEVRDLDQETSVTDEPGS